MPSSTIIPCGFDDARRMACLETGSPIYAGRQIVGSVEEAHERLYRKLAWKLFDDTFVLKALAKD